VHIERQLVQRLGREPRPDELAEELEMTTDEVREITRIAKDPVSLEKPVGEDDDAMLGDFVEDESAESALDSAAVSLRRANVRRVLDALPQRERQVIELRFGLYVERGGGGVSFARMVPSFTPGSASSTTSSTVTYRPSPRSMLSSLVTGSPGRE
jgi:DNA-directed RNA polymerase sigma subunit (sigma70/sigma32)